MFLIRSHGASPVVPLGQVTFTFRGARLGVNSFQVTAHSGAAGLAESDPEEVAVTLEPARPGAWMLVRDDESGSAIALDATGSPRTPQSTVETFRPPGRPFPVHHHWGVSGRTAVLSAWYLPEEGSGARYATELLADGAPVYLKAPAPYDYDVMRGRVTAAGPETPRPDGSVDLSLTVDEIAPEMPG